MGELPASEMSLNINSKDNGERPYNINNDPPLSIVHPNNDSPLSRT